MLLPKAEEKEEKEEKEEEEEELLYHFKFLPLGANDDAHRKRKKKII